MSRWVIFIKLRRFPKKSFNFVNLPTNSITARSTTIISVSSPHGGAIQGSAISKSFGQGRHTTYKYLGGGSVLNFTWVLLKWDCLVLDNWNGEINEKTLSQARRCILWHSLGSRWEHRWYQTSEPLVDNLTKVSARSWSYPADLSSPPLVSSLPPLLPRKCFPGCSASYGTSPSTSAWCQSGEVGKSETQWWKSTASHSRSKSLLLTRQQQPPGERKFFVFFFVFRTMPNVYQGYLYMYGLTSWLDTFSISFEVKYSHCRVNLY